MAYKYAPKELAKLIHEIGDWTTGRFEEVNGKMKPLLKEDAPKEIVEKRDRLFEIVLLDAIAEDGEEGQ